MKKPHWGATLIFRLTLSVVLLGTSWSPSLSVHAQAATAFQQLLNRAEASSRDGQWSESANYWTKFVDINPLVSSYWNQLGTARYNNQDHRGAIPAYQQAMDLGFWPALMAYNMADCYGALGDKQRALSW